MSLVADVAEAGLKVMLFSWACVKKQDRKRRQAEEVRAANDEDDKIDVIIRNIDCIRLVLT